MRQRRRASRLIACAALAWGPEALAVEQVTVQAGVEPYPSPCEDFTSGDYSGTNCPGAVLVRSGADARLGEAFLVSVEAAAGPSWSTDVPAMHDLLREESGPWPFVNGAFLTHFGAGVAVDLPDGEMRAEAGPVFAVDWVHPGTVTRVEEAGVVFDDVARAHLGLRLGWALDVHPSEHVRFGPRFQLQLSNEVAYAWSEAFAARSDFLDAKEEVALVGSDVEVTVLPTFGVALGDGGPVAFALDWGIGVTFADYTAAQEEAIAQLDGWTVAGNEAAPIARLRISGEFRIGEAD